MTTPTDRRPSCCASSTPRSARPACWPPATAATAAVPAALLTSFEDQQLLASGSLLLAELAVSQCAAATGRTAEECLQELCLDMERACTAEGSLCGASGPVHSGRSCRHPGVLY